MNTITANVSALLTHLFTTSGVIELEELKEDEDIITTKVFDIVQPLIILYEVKKLQELVTASHNHYTDTQLINLGIKLIKKLKITRRES